MLRREVENFVATERDEPPPYSGRYNLLVPRSACPSCGHPLSAIENVPLLGWIWLRGRCRHCHAGIPLRYPLVELLSGVLAALLTWRLGTGAAGLAALALSWTLVALAFIDLDTQLLPDDLTLPLLWAGLLINLNGVFAPLPDAVIGAAAGYLSLWLVYWMFRLVTGREGIGFGDFKLLAALGAWLGWTMLPLIVLLSSAVGAAVGLLLVGLQRHQRGKPIPFGPFLALAGLVALIYGRGLMDIWLGQWS
jgi:leader peptidase (prepilin peptidase)/N-methyltransferase